MGLPGDPLAEESPRLPDDPLALSAWELFMDLHDERDVTDMGQPKPIRMATVRSYARALGRRFPRFHYQAVQALDRSYRRAVAERLAESTPSPSSSAPAMPEMRRG